MVVVLMMGYVKLTQASHDLTAKQSQLQQVQEERVALGVAYEKAFDQAAVKAAAQAAGMTKPTSDQIEYIELGGADMAEICRPESTGPLAQAWTWLKDGIGAVVDIKGRKSHQTVSDALSIVERLEHRAGKDAESKTGDGVGIMLQISH